MKYYKKMQSEFTDTFAKMHPEYVMEDCSVNKCHGCNNCVIPITIVVTQECPLRCTYCYQLQKNSDGRMSKETGKAIIDFILEESLKPGSYLTKPAVILDFIGGEPLLEIELIDYMVEYFKYKTISTNHPWVINYMISIASNGVLYNNPKVQSFIQKNNTKLSFTISIDGNKELHDSCRVFPDGTGSYDMASESYKDYLSISNYKGTKLTLCPDNIHHLSGAIKNMFNLGLNEIHANCVYEKGWDIGHAKIMYTEMKELANYLLEDNRYMVYVISLFDETIGKKLTVMDNNNWCGGTGNMMAVDHKGDIYPCLRYVPFCLKEGCKPLIIGDIYKGISATQEQINTITMLENVTRKSQSTEECYDCPIGSGCGWCSAYNYEEHGTVDKRATYICVTHKARVLANVYFWNILYKKLGLNKHFDMCVPKEWALGIIGEDEYDILLDLSK